MYTDRRTAQVLIKYAQIVTARILEERQYDTIVLDEAPADISHEPQWLRDTPPVGIYTHTSYN